MHAATIALILGDLQNDFLHLDGAYGRAGQTSPAIAALPEPACAAGPRGAPAQHADRGDVVHAGARAVRANPSFRLI